MKSKKPITLIQKYKAIQALGISVEVPYEVFRTMGPKHIHIMGDDVLVGSEDSDYVSLDTAQAAVQWYVEQLGGKVSWDE